MPKDPDGIAGIWRGRIASADQARRIARAAATSAIVFGAAGLGSVFGMVERRNLAFAADNLLFLTVMLSAAILINLRRSVIAACVLFALATLFSAITLLGDTLEIVARSRTLISMFNPVLFLVWLPLAILSARAIQAVRVLAGQGAAAGGFRA